VTSCLDPGGGVYAISMPHHPFIERTQMDNQLYMLYPWTMDVHLSILKWKDFSEWILWLCWVLQPGIILTAEIFQSNPRKELCVPLPVFPWVFPNLKVVPSWWAEIELRLETFRFCLKICDLSCVEVSKILTVQLLRYQFRKLRKNTWAPSVDLEKMAHNWVNCYC